MTAGLAGKTAVVTGAAHGIGVIAYSPMQKGLLTGKITRAWVEPPAKPGADRGCRKTAPEPQREYSEARENPAAAH